MTDTNTTQFSGSDPEHASVTGAGSGAFRKVALITGASSGMGLEYARQLAARDYDLIIVSNRKEELEEAAEALRKEFGGGVRVWSLFRDLAAPGAAEEILAWCDAEGLCPDVLINNAGMFFMEYLSSENLPKARTMIRLHVEAVTELSVLFGERMKARGSGYILNVSSMTARIPAPGIAVYSSSKAYLRCFGRSFSYEMRPFGVSVTTVCPAAIDTGLYPLGERLRRFLRSVGIIRSPQTFVRKALRAMFHRRRVVSPGLMNILVPLLVALLPARLIDRLGLKWINRADSSR